MLRLDAFPVLVIDVLRALDAVEHHRFELSVLEVESELDEPVHELDVDFLVVLLAVLDLHFYHLGVVGVVFDQNVREGVLELLLLLLVRELGVGDFDSDQIVLLVTLALE